MWRMTTLWEVLNLTVGETAKTHEEELYNFKEKYINTSLHWENTVPLLRLKEKVIKRKNGTSFIKIKENRCIIVQII